jgi:hypothetical protein
MSEIEPIEASGPPENALKSERDASGHFVRGHHLKSPGRPPGSRQHYLQLRREGISDEDWRVVVRAALRRAMRGDASARAWLGRFLLPYTDSFVGLELRREANAWGRIGIREVVVELQGIDGQTSEERIEDVPGLEPGESGGTS